MKKRIANAMAGFILGILSVPLVAVAWPFAAAYFLYNETDED